MVLRQDLPEGRAWSHGIDGVPEQTIPTSADVPDHQFFHAEHRGAVRSTASRVLGSLVSSLTAEVMPCWAVLEDSIRGRRLAPRPEVSRGRDFDG
jgi:hypothetical protein